MRVLPLTSENGSQPTKFRCRKNLHRYFGGRAGDEFSGRWFEKFAAIGDQDRFEPSDILAVEALSVDVRTESAAKLVLTEADRFSDLLAQIPPGVDLWEVDRSVVGSSSAAAQAACRPRRVARCRVGHGGQADGGEASTVDPHPRQGGENGAETSQGALLGDNADELSDDSRRRRSPTCPPERNGVTELKLGPLSSLTQAFNDFAGSSGT